MSKMEREGRGIGRGACGPKNIFSWHAPPKSAQQQNENPPEDGKLFKKVTTTNHNNDTEDGEMRTLNVMLQLLW